MKRFLTDSSDKQGKITKFFKTVSKNDVSPDTSSRSGKLNEDFPTNIISDLSVSDKMPSSNSELSKKGDEDVLNSSDETDKASTSLRSCITVSRHETPVFASDVFDFGNMTNNRDLDDNVKIKILTSRIAPEVSFIYPISTINTGKQLKFQPKWLERWPWLSYSKSQDGMYCKVCVLFIKNVAVGKGSHEHPNAFVNSSFNKWKRAIERCEKHEKTKYHQACVVYADNFMSVKSGKVQDVASQVDAQRNKEREENRAALRPIIETILFCGEEELPLRGDNDSGPISLTKPDKKDGKFRALLRFRANSGDDILKNHLLTSKKNATYVSPEVQNEIITISATLIQEKLVDKIKKSGLFCVLVDETMDISGTEQMSLCIRYLSVEENKRPIIREDFLAFVPVYDQSAESLSKTILTECARLGLDMNSCVGQGYDGAANMSGHINGVQTRIRQSYPKAIYVHCASHRLNLALSNAMSLPAIRNCLGVVNEIANFFRNNAHANQVLKTHINNLVPKTKKNRLIRLCETRFIERHDSILVFVELFKAIVTGLQEISLESRAVSSTAATLLAATEKSEFAVSLLVCEKLLSFTLPLSKFLQSPTRDLVSALEHANTVISSLESLRETSDTIFKEIFFCASKLIEEVFGNEIRIPRVAGRQTHRANYSANSPEDYYKISVFIPCLDLMIASLKNRFSDNENILTAFNALLPSAAAIEKVELLDPLFAYIDKSFETEIKAEYYLWCKRVSLFKKDTEVLEVLENCNRDFFPNIHHLLRVLATIPVTTTTPERSFSTMKRIKTWLRNKMGNERLSSLAVLSIHWDVDVNPDEVLSAMANKKSRRLVL